MCTTRKINMRRGKGRKSTWDRSEGGREGADKHSNSGVGFSFCRHSVTPLGPLGRVEINQKTLCSPHPRIPHALLPYPGFPPLRLSPLLTSLGPLSSSVQLRPSLVLFPIPFHVWEDRYTGGRDAGKARSDSDGNGSAKMARAD